MKHMKWLGAVATTTFLALAHQGCAVSASSADEEAAIEGEQTGEADQAVLVGAECTKNSECLSPATCIGGKCKQLQEYPPGSGAPIGTSCTKTSDCHSPEVCLGGTCKAVDPGPIVPVP